MYIIAALALSPRPAVQFARLSGAYPVIAVDLNEERRELALKLGADEIDTVLNISAIKNKDYRKALPIIVLLFML